MSDLDIYGGNSMTYRDYYLAHHGVKGMKWGVRRDRGHEGQRTKTSKLNKLDKKYEKNYSKKTGGKIEIHNAVSRGVNQRIGTLNSKFTWEGNLNDAKNAKTKKRYYDAYQKILEDSVSEAMSSIGTNASGTKQISLSVQKDPSGLPYWRYDGLKSVKHDALTDGFVIIPQFDKTGRIVGQKISALSTVDTLIQSGMNAVPSSEMEFITSPDALAHYGVKGMKWGVRKSNEPRVNRRAINERAAREAKAPGYKANKGVNPNYTSKNRNSDTRVYGLKTARRINARMDEGQSYEHAQKIESRKAIGKKAARNLAIITAVEVVTEGPVYQRGVMVARSPQMRDAMLSGAAKAGRGAGAAMRYARRNPDLMKKAGKATRGVYKVTTMR